MAVNTADWNIFIFKYLPLTPALSPFGGEREKNQIVPLLKPQGYARR
jgi:hypothetical protein